jgi:NhaP-type Na+/H+ and K+/H+ antiporter
MRPRSACAASPGRHWTTGRTWSPLASPRTAPRSGDLHLAGDAWVSLITRDGRLVRVRADTVLRAGDEAVPLAGDRYGHEQGELFIGHQQADQAGDQAALTGHPRAA